MLAVRSVLARCVVVLCASSAPPLFDAVAEADRQSWLGPATAVPCDPSAYAVRQVTSGESGIGRGVFATTFIEKGTYLFDYEGVVCLDAEHPGGSDYALFVTNAAGVDFVIDAADTPDFVARYLNHAPIGGDGNNVALFRGAYSTDSEPEPGDDSLPPPRVHFFTRRDISPGEELRFSYGDDYWTGDSPGAIAFRREAAKAAGIPYPEEDEEPG